MAGNSELMDAIRNNVDNHHAKISDALYEKWIELNQNKRIERTEKLVDMDIMRTRPCAGWRAKPQNNVGTD